MSLQLRLLLSREVVEQLRAKSFWVFTAITCLAVAAVIALPTVFASGEDSFEVALVGDTPPALRESIERLGPVLDAQIRQSELSEDRARRAVASGDVDVAVVDGRRLLVDEPVDPASPSARNQLVLLVERTARSLSALTDAGLADEAALGALSAPPLPVEAVGEAGVSGGQQAAAATAVIAVFVLIQTYSSSTLNAVNREKASRLVEVLLLTTRPRQILAAKVLGSFAAALVQVAAVLVTYVVTAAAIGESPAFEDVGFRPFAVACLWFALGFAVYASLAGALGALTNRARDTGGVMAPIMIPLLAGYAFAVASVGNDEPTTVTRILSFVPLTSPTVMTSRMVTGTASGAEIAAAVAATVLGALAVLWLGGRVFARAVGQTGRKIPLKEALLTAVGRQVRVPSGDR